MSDFGDFSVPGPGLWPDLGTTSPQLRHPTAERARPPRRRPPSCTVRSQVRRSRMLS